MLKSVVKLEPPSPPHSGISYNIGSSVLLKTENGEFLEDGHEEMKVSDQQHNAEISSVLIKTENGQFRETYHEETRVADPHQNAESSFVVVKTEDGQFFEDDNENSTVCDVEQNAENSFVQVKAENGQFLEDGHKESEVSDMEHSAGDKEEVAGDPLEEVDVIPKVELTVNFEDEMEEENHFKESEEVNNSEISPDKDVDEVEHRCKMCRRRCSSGRALQLHVWRRHPQPRMTTCQWCKIYKSKRRSDVKRHEGTCVYRSSNHQKKDGRPTVSLPTVTLHRERFGELTRSPGAGKRTFRSKKRTSERLQEMAKKSKDSNVSENNKRRDSRDTATILTPPVAQQIRDVPQSVNSVPPPVGAGEEMGHIAKAESDLKDGAILSQEKEVRQYTLNTGHSVKIKTRRVYYPDGRIFEIVERTTKINREEKNVQCPA